MLLTPLAFAVVFSVPAAAQGLPDGDGKDVYENVCGACHGADIVIGSQGTKARWEETVDAMKNRGASGSDEDFKTVTNYLAKYFGMSVNMNTATMLLSLPRDLGQHPETNKKIIANIGRFGPYVNHDGKFKSIPKSDSVFNIDLAGAVTLLAAANTGPAPIADLGAHPSGEGLVEIYAGRYGPYVQHAKVRATIPKSIEPETLTMDEALGLLAEKMAKDEATGKTGSKKPAAKKPAIKKAPVKKAVAKKVTPKKAVTKKTTAKKPAAKKVVS